MSGWDGLGGPLQARTVRGGAPRVDVATDWVTLSLVREGSATVTGSFGSRRVSRYDVLLLVPGATVGVTPHGAVCFDVVAVDADWLVDVLFWRHWEVFSDRLQARRLVVSWRNPPVRFGRVDGVQIAALDSWLDELTELTGSVHAGRGFVHQVVVLKILDVLSAVFGLDTARLPTPPPSRPGVRRRPLVVLRPELRVVVELLRSCPEQRWTLRRLAEVAHLSPTWFAHVFSKTFGKPPIVFLTMVRVEKLAYLLRTTTDPVASSANLTK